nr:MAG TPA: hypothetical protein [Caudoviricetes sp.]
MVRVRCFRGCAGRWCGFRQCFGVVGWLAGGMVVRL